MTTENIIINIREDGSRVVSRNLQELGSSAETAAKKNDILHSSLRKATDQAYLFERAFQRIIAVLAVKQFIEMADSAVLLDARLKMLTKSSADLAKAQQDVYTIAQANALGLRETGNLYSKLIDPVTRMGGSIKDVGVITDAFASSLKISGASTSEAAAATLQFAQAMGSGRLQGDEFRSMTENNARLLKVLSEEMGIPIERLKQMSSEGLLTSDVIGNALVKSYAKLKRESQDLSNQLISSAFTRLYNDAIQLVDAINKTTGVGAGMIEMIGGLSVVSSTLTKILKEDLADGANKAGGELDLMSGTILAVGTVLETLILVGSDVAFVFKGIGREIGGISAQLGAIAVGDFKLVSNIRQEMINDANKAAEDLEKFQNRIAGLTDRALAERQKLNNKSALEGSGAVLKQVFNEKELIDVRMKLAGIDKSYLTTLNTINEAYKAGNIQLPEYKRLLTELAIATYDKSVAGKAHVKSLKEEKTDYIGLMKSISEKSEVQKQELQIEDKLTSAQKFALKVMTDLRDNNIKLVATKKLSIEQQKINIAQGLEEYLQADNLNRIKKDEAKARQDLFDIAQKEIDSLDEQIKTQKEHNEQIGKTKAEIDLLKNARLLDAAATLDQQAAELSLNVVMGKASIEMFKYVDQLKEAANKKRELASVFREGSMLEETEAFNEQMRKSAEKMENAFNASSRRIETGIYDAIAAGGDRARKKIISDFKNWFARLVLEPIIKPITQFGASIINPNAPSAANSISNLISGGKNLYDMFTGGASAAYSSFAYSSIGQGLGLSSVVPGMAEEMAMLGGIGGSGSGLALTTLGSIGSTLATIAPYLAAAAVLYKGLSMGEKQMTGQTVTGSLGTDNISRNVSWTQQGGFLRGSRSGTWSYNLANSTAIQGGIGYVDTASLTSDKTLLTQLNSMYDALKKSNAEYAKTLGVNADIIMNRSDEINFEFGKTAEETKANISKVFDEINGKMAVDLLKNLGLIGKEGETASQTLARLTTNFTVVNEAFTTLGLKLLEIGKNGIDAADKLVSLVGGLDAFKSISASYYENFYTAEEKTLKVMNQLANEFIRLNVGTLPTTREGFRALVEKLSELGDTDKLAGVLKLANAFASVIPETEKMTTVMEGTTVVLENVAEAVVKISDAQEGYMDLLRSQEKQDSAFLIAQESSIRFEAQLRRQQIADRKAILEKEAAMQSQALTTFTTTGGGLFEYVSTFYNEMEGLASVFREVSASALTIQNVGDKFAAIKEFAMDSVTYKEAIKKNLQEGINVPAIGRYAGAGRLAEMAAEMTASQYMAGGSDGISRVLGAQNSLTALREVTDQYFKTVSNLDKELAIGRLSADGYAETLKFSRDMALKAGGAIDEVSFRLRELDAITTLQAAGYASAIFYFGKLAENVAALDKAAADANQPISVLAATVGRLNSAAFVFGESAKAMGGTYGGTKDIASAIAKAATDATLWLNTKGGEEVKRQFASNAAFAGVDFQKIGPMLDTVNAWDISGYEAAFNRLSNALVEGALNVDQYNALLGYAKDKFQDNSTKFTDELSKATDGLIKFKQKLMQDYQQTLSPQQGFEYARANLAKATVDNVQDLVSTYLQSAKISAVSKLDYLTKVDQGIQTVNRFIPGEGGGSPNQDVVDAVKTVTAKLEEVQAELAELRAVSNRSANQMGNVAKTVDEWNTEGMPKERTF